MSASTTWTAEQAEANADAMEPLPSLAHKFAGTTVRYTPPRCDEHRRNQVCRNLDDHRPSGVKLDENLQLFGLKRDRQGRSYFPPPARSRGEAAIPKRTQENIAACAAVGLSYWSEGYAPNLLWAVDDTTRRAHQVRIDRKAGKAEHHCHTTGRYDPKTQRPRPDSEQSCGSECGRTEKWSIARTQDELALQLEGRVAADEPAPSAEPEEMPRSSSADPAPTVMEMSYALHNQKPMSREVARSLLLHDPGYLDDIPTGTLADLRHDPYCEEHYHVIAAELHRRELTPAAGA